MAHGCATINQVNEQKENIMFKVNITKEKVYTVKMVKLHTCPKPFNHGNNTKTKDNEICLKLISTYIKSNRFELLGTCSGYKLILNGYNHFKCVKLTNGNIVSRDTIYRHMQAAEDGGCVMPITNVTMM